MTREAAYLKGDMIFGVDIGDEAATVVVARRLPDGRLQIEDIVTVTRAENGPGTQDSNALEFELSPTRLSH